MARPSKARRRLAVQQLDAMTDDELMRAYLAAVIRTGRWRASDPRRIIATSIWLAQRGIR